MKRAHLPAVITVVSAWTAACALFRHGVAPYPTGMIFPLTPAFSVTTAGDAVDSLELMGDSLVFSVREGMVQCIDAAERKPIWKFTMAAAAGGPVVLGRERVYAWDAEGTVYCLDDQGRSLWTSTLTEPASGGACEGGDRFFIATAGGGLLALDAQTGGVVWRFQAEAEIRSVPAWSQGLAVFGTEDGSVYFLRPDGRPAGRFSESGAVRGSILVVSGRVVFGSLDYCVTCVGLADRRLKWRARVGGPVEGVPVSDGERLYVVARNNVLYCLSLKGGDLHWWRPVPDRSTFRPLIVEDRIAVASQSVRLVCFDAATGAECGTYTAPLEVRTNPVWKSPHVIVSHYDRSTAEGRLSFLKKDVKVALSFSKSSPQRPNEEIAVTAQPSALFRPQFEYQLSRYAFFRFGLGGMIAVKTGEGDPAVVRPLSPDPAWTWFPEEPGWYLIEIRAVDEQESASTRTWFRIESDRTASIAPGAETIKGESHVTG